MLTDLELGGIAAQLALRFPSWIERRVEHVSYLDRSTTRWSVGVMFRWPAEDFFPKDTRPTHGDTIYLPLDLLTKRPIVGLEGIRPDGSPFPVLPLERGAELTHRGITWLIGGKAEQTGRKEPKLEQSTVNILKAIVSSPPEYARPLLDVALSSPHVELSTLLQADDSARGLLEELATYLMLLAPAEYRPGQEEVWRYSYFKPIPKEPGQLKRIRERLLFDDLKIRHKRLSLGWCRSYHFEADAPGELSISRGLMLAKYGPNAADRAGRPIAEADGSRVIDLQARRPNQNALAPDEADSPPVAPLVPPAAPGSADAAVHLQTALDATPSATKRSDQGEATVWFRLDPYGTFLATTAVSLLTLLLLVAATLRLSQLDGQTGAALLLALPGLTLGYMTRPGEHSLATRLLAGIRLAALGVGLCSLVVAWILAGGFVHHRPASPGRYECQAQFTDLDVHPAPHHTWRTTADPDVTQMNCHAGKTEPESASVSSLARGIVIGATVLAGLFTAWLLGGWGYTVVRPARLSPSGNAAPPVPDGQDDS